MTETQTIGGQIKGLRQAHGLSLRELAQGANVSAGTLSRWEAGHYLPGMPELAAVLSALGASEAQKRAMLRLIHAPRAVQRLRVLDDAGAFAPFGGDMLWTIRQRRGWTQAQVARAVGVTQAQVARWEGGDTWPSTSVLHTLCWHLNAHPDEVVALSRYGDGTSLNEPQGDEPKRWDKERWENFVFNLIYHPSDDVGDLPLLAAEQQLIQIAQTDTNRQEFAIALLADVYAIHARGYSYRGQFGRARRWAERGLLLARQQGVETVASRSTNFWFGNILTLVSSARQGKRPANLRYAVRLLRDWLPVLPKTDPHYSWGQMSLASTLGSLKHYDEAIYLGEKACENAEKLDGPNRSDSALRWRDLAQLLLDIGQPAQAVEALSQSTTWWPLSRMPADTAARHHLLSAECFGVLENKQGVRAHMEAAERLIASHRLFHLQADFSRIDFVVDAGQ